MTLEFARTTCACAECVQCCKEQPGALIPGDLERIAAHLGETPEEAARHFWSSPGALLMDSRSGRTFRQRTITPRAVDGRCVFLDAYDRCRVHAVSPAGCAYFDTHLSRAEGERRSFAVVVLQRDADYQQLRTTLPAADSYKPRRV